jgi:hypothetical protein
VRCLPAQQHQADDLSHELHQDTGDDERVDDRPQREEARDDRDRPQRRWRADWPDHEGYDAGPPSIGWLTWHVGFWWSMVLDHSFGNGSLSRETVMWPGNADGVREWLGRLEGQWQAVLDQITDDELRSPQRTRWPFRGRPFGDVIAWVNLELTKNAAEIGYARFLYAVRAT